MNKLYLILSALLILAITFAASSSAQEQNQTPPTERQILAVSTVRTINTAEAAYRFSKEKGATQHRDRFATWSDLYSSGVLDEMKPPTNVSSLITADGIRDYKLALIVSPDGQSYQLALHDATRQNALFSVFSDQSGIIYTGSPLQ
jgi:hypothetical protein